MRKTRLCNKATGLQHCFPTILCRGGLPIRLPARLPQIGADTTPAETHMTVCQERDDALSTNYVLVL
jgi:hypothetical protein